LSVLLGVELCKKQKTKEKDEKKSCLSLTIEILRTPTGKVGSSSIAFVCSSLVYPFSKMHCHIFVPTL